MTNIRDVWDVYEAHASDHGINSVGLLVKQRQLLMANMLIWEWLARQLDLAYEQERDDPSSGLGRLLRRLEIALESRPTELSVDASEFLPHFVKGEAVYHSSQATKRYIRADKLETVSLASAVLQHWLSFPDKSTYQTQSWFVRELLDQVGPQILLLNETWAASCRINVNVLGKSKNCQVTQRDLKEWTKKALSKHDISNTASSQYHLLCAIHEEVGAMFPNDFSSLTTSRPPTDLLPSSTSRLAANVTPVQRSTPSTSYRSVPNPAAVAIFYRQIELLYCFLDNPTQNVTCPRKGTTAASLNAHWTAKYQQHVYGASDKKLPFRDLATSRRRIMAAGGPFSTHNLHTRAGLYSVLIHRGITHHTQFLLDQQTVFANYDEYKSICDAIEEDETYFCSKSAYGSPTCRERSNALPYWNATFEPEFEAFIAARKPAPFMQTYNMFLTLKGFGPLTAYQTSADYVTAGKVCEPTKEEMGCIVWRIKAGALTGLDLLGFRCWDEASTVSAFIAVYGEMERRIPPERKIQMDFGPIFVEHALCKHDRLNIASFRKITH